MPAPTARCNGRTLSGPPVLPASLAGMNGRTLSGPGRSPQLAGMAVRFLARPPVLPARRNGRTLSSPPAGAPTQLAGIAVVRFLDQTSKNRAIGWVLEPNKSSVKPTKLFGGGVVAGVDRTWVRQKPSEWVLEPTRSVFAVTELARTQSVYKARKNGVAPVHSLCFAFPVNPEGESCSCRVPRTSSSLCIRAIA